MQECTIRGLIYVGLARGRVDERGVNALQANQALGWDAAALACRIQGDGARSVLHAAARYRKRRLRRFPALLPAEAAQRQKAFDSIKKVLEASGELTGEAVERLNKVKELFGLGETGAWPALRGESLKLVPKLEPSEKTEAPVAVLRKEGQS